MYLLRKGAYRDNSHIILKHIQYVTSWYQKYLHKGKEGKVMTATNMCSNFGGFRCIPPLSAGFLAVSVKNCDGKKKTAELTVFKAL